VLAAVACLAAAWRARRAAMDAAIRLLEIGAEVAAVEK
jgi:hypothetical protein